MTREKAEKKILDLLVEVAKVVRDYGAPSGYLNVAIYVEPPYGTGAYISFNNERWEGGRDEKAGKPIDHTEFGIYLGEQK